MRVIENSLDKVEEVVVDKQFRSMEYILHDQVKWGSEEGYRVRDNREIMNFNSRDVPNKKLLDIRL